MDILEPVCIILSTVAEAVQVCQENRNAATEWKSEKRFCSGLRSTLEAIIACSPSDENFTYDQELNLLTQAILQPLPDFCHVLTPYTSSLQRRCEASDSKQVLAQLEVQLKDLVIPPVKVLREQVHRYLQGINTLLLLYAVYACSSHY